VTYATSAFDPEFSETAGKKNCGSQGQSLASLQTDYTIYTSEFGHTSTASIHPPTNILTSTTGSGIIEDAQRQVLVADVAKLQSTGTKIHPL
jgi:hypothetical protein